MSSFSIELYFQEPCLLQARKSTCAVVTSDWSTSGIPDLVIYPPLYNISNFVCIFQRLIPRWERAFSVLTNLYYWQRRTQLSAIFQQTWKFNTPQDRNMHDIVGCQVMVLGNMTCIYNARAYVCKLWTMSAIVSVSFSMSYVSIVVSWWPSGWTLISVNKAVQRKGSNL